MTVVTAGAETLGGNMGPCAEPASGERSLACFPCRIKFFRFCAELSANCLRDVVALPESCRLCSCNFISGADS